MAGELEVRREGHLVELVDARLGWLCRFESLPESTATHRSAMGAVVLGQLSAGVPGLVEVLSAEATYRVVFAPAIQKGLASGAFRLMGGSLPTAIDSAGRTVGNARVIDQATSMAGAIAGLSMGVGLAAAIAQQRWLEQTLEGIAATASAIEDRLQDDDWGALEHATEVARRCWVAAERGGVPEQLRLELAAARNCVGSIVASRRRFTERLIKRLNDLYGEHDRRGQETPWGADVAKELGGGLDELLLHLGGLHALGVVDAATAAVLALAGDGAEASHLVGSSVDAIRADYHLLYRYFRPLARFAPVARGLGGLVDRIPGSVVAERGPLASTRRMHEQAQRLFAYLDDQVGDSIPVLEEQPYELVIDTAMLALPPS